jgi:hypothetical protein
MRDPGADPHHGEELSLGMDRRAVEVGQEAPILLRICHVTSLACDGIDVLATLKSKHDQVPQEPGNTFFERMLLLMLSINIHTYFKNTQDVLV